MAKPPAGYSAQPGAYFTDDGQGPYYWDGAAMVLASAQGADDVRVFPITGAGDFNLVAGVGSLLSVVLDTSVLSTPGLTFFDNLGPSGPLVTTATNTAAATNVTFTYGAANVGAPFVTGLCMRVTGAQVGRVFVRVGA